MIQAELFGRSVEAPVALTSEPELARACERLLSEDGNDDATLHALRVGIWRGEDPLGDAFLSVRSADTRRTAGAVYTPRAIVDAMIAWIASRCEPVRVVDPGAGSGRFLLAAGRRLSAASLVGVEPDPLAALMLRANARTLALAPRLVVHEADYRRIVLPRVSGSTVFVGNPPYVRHHQIDAPWKRWYREECLRFGVKASALAGLHLHFFLQTLRLARPGDVGLFVTAAEWLDVNYGSALRELLVEHLGIVDLRVLEPAVEAFPGTATTAALTGFVAGEQTAPLSVRVLSRLQDFAQPPAASEVPRAELRSHPRWSILVRRGGAQSRQGIELGELFRVHRGQVTGANDVWVNSESHPELPDRFCLPAITKARELIAAGERLNSDLGLRRVIELPLELDQVARDERELVERFLRWARLRGADRGYIARHRKAWWSVGLREPAPILCTYMGRRPPQFTVNACGARHINIAHGLYPRTAMDPAMMTRVARWLNGHVGVECGRTYAGGLTKFEPRELERVRLPEPSSLPA